MKYAIPSLLFCLPLALPLALPGEAEAASWHWSRSSGQEQITIEPDAPAATADTRRTGEQALTLTLTPPPQNLELRGEGPAPDALFSGLTLENGDIHLTTSSPAFGFISPRPTASGVVIVLYSDPLGLRWRPDGGLAPPSSAASAPPAADPPANSPASPAQAASATPAVAETAPSSAAAPARTPPGTSPTPPRPADASPGTAPAVSPSATPNAPDGQAPAGSSASSETRRVDQPVPAGAADSTPPSPSAGAESAQPASTPQTSAGRNPEGAGVQESTPAPAVPTQRASQQPGAAASPGTAATDPMRGSAAPVSSSEIPQPNAPGPAPAPVVSTVTGETPSSASTRPSQAAPQDVTASVPGTAVSPAISAPPQDRTAREIPPASSAQQAAGGNIVLEKNTTVIVTPSAPGAPAAAQAPSAPEPAVSAPSSPAPAASPQSGAAQANVVSTQTGAVPPVEPVVAPTPSPGAEAESPPPVPMVRGRLNMSGPEAATGALSSGATAPAGTTPGSGPSSSAPPPSAVSGAQASSFASAQSEDSSSDGAARAQAADPQDSAAAHPTSVAQASESKDGSSRAQGEHTQKGQARQPELPPIYVDEEGNPVPPPPDVPALQGLMREALKTGHYSEMLLPIQTLREVELNREEREELLYNAMTALYEVSRPDFAERSQELISAANEAMNFNLDSPRVPDALAVLATVNLALGNVEDARGYTQLLRRKYPHSLHVPAALLELGAKEMERQEYAEAALTLQTILQEYPDSPLAKNAARLETYALYRQGHMERALTLVDFVERRWPRLYLEDPEYLAISADIRFRQGHLEDALRSYWTQYNLKPLAPEAASTLQHIATAYYLLGNSEAAAKVLDQLVQAFPQSAEAPAALLHLGENGIHDDNPTVDELIALFEAPNPRLPGLYYQRIINEYPESPEFMTAQLRSIVWQLWNEEYYPAMTAARGFLIDYADKPESNRARTVLLRGFAHELGTSLREENFERVLRLWEDFPQVHDEYLPLEPDMRMALARANLNRGNEQEGLELLSAFLNGPGDTDDALYSYNLFLATYLNQQNWDGILSLGEKVENWPLPEEARNQLDYAMALSAENLGLQGRALPLWTRLAERTDIPLYQRAYATYFLARSAEERQDLRAAYQYNLDTLGMFTQLQDEQSPYADPERVRESIAALMDVTEIAGRYAEALEWANRYALFVPDSSPDYAGLQFREAGLHRKMGDMTRWRVLLQGIVDREPDSVFGKMAASELRTQDVARDLTRFTGN